MPDFVVSTAFRTKDEMAETFKKMGLEGNRFAQGLVKNFDKVKRKGISTKRIMGGILGAAAVQRGLSLVQRGIAGVTAEFLDFDDAITAASSKFGIFDRQSPAFKALGDTAREVGASTEFTATQAAEGLRFLAKAGWEANSAMSALPSFVDLATAAEMDFARAADIATDVMGAFGLQSKDARENLKQLTRVNDVMSKAVNMANVDMEDLFETIKFAGPIAKTAGVSLEQFSAMAAFIGGAGIKGSMGGTALRTMFLNLIAPTDSVKGKLAEFNTEIKNVKQLKDNREALKALGIQLDETGKLSPIETLRELSERMKELGPTAKAAALNVIFGKRAVSGAAVSLEGATGALQDFEKQLDNAGGTSKKMAAFMRDSLKKRLDEVKSAAVETGLKFIYAFKNKFPGGVDSAIKAIRGFDVAPLISGVEEAIKVSKDFLELLKAYKGVLLGAAAGFAALKVGSFVAAMWGVVGVAKALVAVGGFKAMFAGLALATGPVAAVALAIGGLTAGISALVTHWDDLGQIIKDFSVDALKWLNKLWKHPLIGMLLPGGDPRRDMEFFDESGNRTSMRAKAKREGEVAPALADAVKTEFARATSLSTGAGPSKSAKPTGAPSIQQLAEQSVKVQQMVKAMRAAQARGITVPASQGAPSLVQPDRDKRVVAPNQRSVEQQKQRIQFEGRLDVAGAPKGSSVSTKTRGAPPIRTNLLGAN